MNEGHATFKSAEGTDLTRPLAPPKLGGLTALASPHPSSRRTSPSRVFGLDLLRCVAILMVLLGHTRFFVRPLLPAAQDLSVFGYLGVELFFVLSGFLIGGILLRSFGDAPTVSSLGSFWIRRWFRTLPNYYLFLAVNLGLEALLVRREPASALVPYAFFFQNLAWRARVFFNESWSLAIEEWFYLLFPIVLVAVSALRPRRRGAVAVSLALLFACSTILRVWIAGRPGVNWDADVRKVVVYRLDALMIGVLGAYLRAGWPAAWSRARRPAATAGLALLVAATALYFLLDRNASFFAKSFYFTLTSLSVFCLLPALEAWGEARGALAAGVQRISLWSYSLYLCQLPVAALLIAVFGDPEARGTSFGAGTILALAAAFVLVSIAVSAAVYTWYERPATDLRERFAR
jgi:peptidoglycan/LPS O-acetylase OafA/YrhL